MIKKYLIVIVSILFALIVFALLTKVMKKYFAKKNIIDIRHILSLVSGIIIFFLLTLYMERNSGEPFSKYYPPKLENGLIKEGNFEK